MDGYRTPVAVELTSAVRPEGKRLRRKLQKIPNQRNSISFAVSNPKASESRGFLSAFSSKKAEPGRPRATLTEPLPIDLSDPKWDEYLRTSRYTATEIEFVPQPSRDSLLPPADIIPEFAHLNVTNEAARKSSETVSTDGPSTPCNASLAGSATRRCPKTPVTHIGQLEAVAAREPPLADNAGSIEQIAESYRALLDSRNSFTEERFMTPFQTFEEIPSDFESRLRDVPDATLLKTIFDLPQTPKQEMGSPTSSDGTLVGFEEDAIYFKPVSFSSTFSNPRLAGAGVGPRYTKSMASILPENPTFPIIFDLLAKELSAVASGNMTWPGAETSALQIWVMIEAYERLRDKVEDMGLGVEQAQPVQAMFSTWLQALHVIHDNMTGNDGQQSESDYGEY